MSKRAHVVLSAVLLGGCGGGGPADMAPPSTPTNLTAQLVEANTVDLTWNPSVDDVAVAGYRVFRDGNFIGAAPGTSYLDGEAPVAEICYTVLAYDDAGNESDQSDPACIDLARAWIVRAAGVRTDLNGVAWSGTRFAAAGTGDLESDYFMLSDDGARWLPKHHEFFPGADLIESDGSQFVLFTGLGVYVSPDGQSGTIVGDDPWIGLDTASDVVWSGSELIAVGPGGRIFGSTDGETWTERTSSTTEDLSGAVSAAGAQLVAVGAAGAIVTSTDGSNWTLADSGSTDSLERVAWSGSSFLALGANEVLTSPDGASWTPASSPPGDAIAIAGSPDLDLFVAGGRNGLIATSPDGVTWTQRQVATPYSFLDVIWANTRFVAVGEAGTIATSTDGGDTWQVQSFGDSLFDVAWLGDRLVAVGSTGRVSVSTDGIQWTHGWTGDRNHSHQDIAYSGSTYVIAGYMWLLSSPDLETWTGYSLGVGECRGVIWTGSIFAAACTGSAVRTSANGTTWTTHFVDGTLATDVNAIAWTGSQFVAVGEAGAIFTSPDGSTWTPRTSGTLARLFGVAWSGSRFVAAGEAGTILSSSDGASWTPATSNTTVTLSDVAWLDDQFVVVGDDGTIMTSSDGTAWEDRSSAEPSPRLHGVSSVNGRIVAVGEPGYILMSP